MKGLLIISAIASVFSVIAPANAVSRAEVAAINIGTAYEAVHSAIGTGKTDLSGLKEIYILNNGGKAIAQYEDGILSRGFLIDD